MESIETKEAEQLDHDLASLSLDSAYPHPDNDATPNDEEYNYEWLLGTGLFNNVVVVDNLPVVGANGVEKLESWVQMNCGKYGVIKKDGVSMTLNPRTQESLGYCFIEYSTRKEAENAQKNLNGQKMDEGHTLSAYLYNEFDRNMDTPDGRTPPETAPYFDRENAQQWDEKARDQKMLRDGEANEKGEEDEVKSVDIKEIPTVKEEFAQLGANMDGWF